MQDLRFSRTFKYEAYCRLECETVHSGRQSQIFKKNILHLISE
jgi:hypothetical protein